MLISINSLSSRSITSILGKEEVMRAAEDTFISSTFWTERSGPTAALKTLEIMERNNTWSLITKKGNKIRQGWEELAQKHGLEINHWGLPALAGFNFSSKDSNKYKTFITQEMLKHNILATNSIYSSIFHTEDNMSEYFKVLDSIFEVIKECEDGKDIFSLLEGPVCHSGFSRLN